MSLCNSGERVGICVYVPREVKSMMATDGFNVMQQNSVSEVHRWYQLPQLPVRRVLSFKFMHIHKSLSGYEFKDGAGLRA